MASRSPTAIATGLHADEMVLRGGRLTCPTVLTGLVVVEGRQYVRLARHSDVLCHFFTAKSRGLAPLAGNPVFDQIAALRHEFLLNFGKGDTQVEEHDKTDDLGLDASDDEGLAPMCRRSRRNLRVVSKALPTDFEATLSRPGQSDWRFRMLCERGNRAPCIEATSGNFDVLFKLVSDALVKQGAKRGATAKQPSRRSPRGEPGAREYWLESKQRWLRVEFEEGEQVGKKKRRTLTRKMSNPAVLPLAAPASSSSSESLGGGGDPEVAEAAVKDLLG